MEELNLIEIEEVGGGLLFVPVLIVSVVSAYAGGYIAGKIMK
jgi:hypothetical protein